MGGLRERHEGELEQEPLKSDDEKAELFVPGRTGSNAGVAGRAEAMRQRRSEGAESLPHLDMIQQSFGTHDVSDVRAYVGGSAKETADSVGAEAYVSEGEAAFGETPDLHTAAHEAAHIVHQRSGLVGDSGVMPAGDVHEQHADQVADLVVQGQSAEGLLDQYPDAGASTEAVQCKAKAGGSVTAATANEAAPLRNGKPNETAKDFTEQEKAWIREVLAEEYWSMFFRSYGEVPDVVLHRLGDLGSEGRTSGTFFSGEGKIGLADQIYNGDRTLHEQDDGSKHASTDEETFKGTLIHELFHYMEHHVADMSAALPDGVTRPDHLIEALRWPEQVGLPKYAFGWFVHPDTNAWLHFDIPETRIIGGIGILGYSELVEVQESGNYEHSPMAQSGNRISAEEDMCETVSRYLVSKATRDGLANEFPDRFWLMELFFRNVLPKMAR